LVEFGDFWVAMWGSAEKLLWKTKTYQGEAGNLRGNASIVRVKQIKVEAD